MMEGSGDPDQSAQQISMVIAHAMTTHGLPIVRRLTKPRQPHVHLLRTRASLDDRK
jgi:hypothetical protein